MLLCPSAQIVSVLSLAREQTADGASPCNSGWAKPTSKPPPATLVNPSATPSIPADWQAEFEAAARRPLEQRWCHAFITTHKPVLDDARFRSFDTLQPHRRIGHKFRTMTHRGGAYKAA